MLSCYSSQYGCAAPRRGAASVLQRHTSGNKRCRSSFYGARLVHLPLGLHPRGQRRPCSKSPQASFFGVGAPEAIVVGLVAVVIFGPQGLAEAAKSLGQTVKAIKPTYDELMSTSQDMKSSLESSLGIDDVRRSFNSATTFDTDSLGTTATSTKSFRNEDGSPKFSLGGPGSSIDSNDAGIDAQRAKSAEMAWGGSSANDASSSSSSSSVGHAEAGNSEVDALSLEDLQAELERRGKKEQQNA